MACLTSGLLSAVCVKTFSFVPEEKFAQAVCFLLVDLYLLTFQPEKALHLLAVLDKLSAQGGSRNGKGEVSGAGSVMKRRLIYRRRLCST